VGFAEKIDQVKENHSVNRYGVPIPTNDDRNTALSAGRRSQRLTTGGQGLPSPLTTSERFEKHLMCIISKLRCGQIKLRCVRKKLRWVEPSNL
jgi:hypothetical protein